MCLYYMKTQLFIMTFLSFPVVEMGSFEYGLPQLQQAVFSGPSFPAFFHIAQNRLPGKEFE